MKSIFLVLVTFTLGTCICAQPFGEAASNYRVIKLEYENSSGENGITNFKYDQFGKLTKAYWSLTDCSRSSVNSYEYDTNGWLTTSYREFSDGLTSFEFFSYNSFGNKVSENFYRSDHVSGSASYEYDGKQLMKAGLKNHKGWLNGTVTYQYDQQNRRVDALLLKDEKVICNINYEYDSIGNLLKEFWNFQGKWNQIFSYYYEKINTDKDYYSSPFFSDLGMYRISKENYTYNNEIGGPSFYYYDTKGLLYKKEFIRSDSFSTNTVFEYDPERKLVSSLRTLSNGKNTQFSYHYDGNRNLILRQYFSNDTLIGFESYLYNTEGDIIKAYVRNLDGWLTGTISFNYDQLGRIKSGDFKGENGFNALIVFKNNSDGLPSEINWEFTFGKFQHYVYEYERKDQSKR